MNRRELLRAGGALAALGPAAQALQRGDGTGGGGGEGAEGKLRLEETDPPLPARPSGFRVLSWYANRLLAHGGSASDPIRLALVRTQAPQRVGLELALHWPDVITLQSLPGDRFVQPIAETLGMRYALLVSPTKNHGGVLTRHHFVQRYDLPAEPLPVRRELVPDHFARIGIRVDEVEHAVYSVQLHEDAERRAAQVELVLEHLRKDLEAGVSLILQGAFSHRPEDPEYARWIEAGLIDAFAAKGTGDPFTRPWEAPGNRLDYVFVHGAIAACLQECRVLDDAALCGDPDDPASIALSPRRPILTTFS
jgi:endonuclease/exonuclease/phosphatase family metal-dependent hydrolase